MMTRNINLHNLVVHHKNIHAYYVTGKIKLFNFAIYLNKKKLVQYNIQCTPSMTPFNFKPPQAHIVAKLPIENLEYSENTAFSNNKLCTRSLKYSKSIPHKKF